MDFLRKLLAVAVLLKQVFNFGTVGASQSCVRIARGVVDNPSITEASGLCYSRKHHDIIYTHNDSGNGPKLYALRASTAELVATYTVDQASSGDWEDIACHGGHIYLANLGSHSSDKRIYIIDEPAELSDSTLSIKGSKGIDWSAGDSETLMVAPNGDVFIVPKTYLSFASLYKVPSGPWDGSVVQPINLGLIKGLMSLLKGPVGGDISEDGQGVLLKTYRSIFFWNVPGTIEEALTGFNNLPKTLNYEKENQGEAVCFSSDSHSFFTLSEGSDQPLYHYQCTD